MKTRRRAREIAVQVLYQCDTLNEWDDEAVDICLSVLLGIEEDKLGDGERSCVNFARKVIQGVIQKRSYLDKQIAAASTHWSLTRMARVDRNILRTAVYEIAMEEDIPASVSINEAIEIAKKFGADDSPMFINGVLDKVARQLEGAKEERKIA